MSIVLFLAVFVTAGCVAACPSVAACRQYDVSCNTSSVIELDPDLLGPFPPGVHYSGSAWCHVVNCNGQAAALGGEIPCDLPSNTSILLLASIGMNGSFSFQTLLERAPSLFCHTNTEECPARVGLVDLSANEIADVNHRGWDNFELTAYLDLSDNKITTLPPDTFANAQISGDLDLSGNNIPILLKNTFDSAKVGNLDLSRNDITAVHGLAFSGATIKGNLDLSGNSITNAQPYAFQSATINGTVDLSGNSIATVQEFTFFGVTIGGSLCLNGSTISNIEPRAFPSVSIGGHLDLSHNNIATLDPFIVYSTTINGNVNLSGNVITTVQTNAFASATIGGDLDFSGNSISTLEPSAFFGTTISGALNLRGNRLVALQNSTFIFANFGSIDLSDNNISHITGGSFNESSNIAGSFYNSSMGALNLANNRLTALYADTFAGMRINVAVNFTNNSIVLLEKGWSSAFPLEITLSMTDNPSNCSVGILHNTLESFVCTCAHSDRLDILGNGAYCSRAPCAAPDDIFVANGSFTCSEHSYASGSTCNLVCENGYNHLDASFTSITCLGGVWGKRPNLAAMYPVCVQQNQLCSAIPSAAVTNGHFHCHAGTTFSRGTNCTLICDRGYAPLGGINATCLRGQANNSVWGIWPHQTYMFPACAPKSSGISKEHAGLIALGSCIGGLLIALVIYLLTKFRQRMRRVEFDLELQRHLLSEQGEELDALRQVFTIPADEVRLEACIDSGAFGEVWRGRWNDMPVAVKRMQAVLLALDDSFAREFEAETTLMRRLRHANVVTFFGAGTDRDGMPFLVCELMANSLQKLVWETEPLSEQQKVKWARDAAQGMAFLHAKGVIHRDLKSGNLLGTVFWGIGE